MTDNKIYDRILFPKVACECKNPNKSIDDEEVTNEVRDVTPRDKEKLKVFWSVPSLSESFYYLPPEAWKGDDPADYYAYVMRYRHEFRICHWLGINADNFLPYFKMDELDDDEEVTSDATE